MPNRPAIGRRHYLFAALLALVLAACGGEPRGEPVRFTVPEGSGLSAVSDTLAARDIIGSPALFKLYVRFKGAARALKPGVYELRRGTAWEEVLAKLTSGEVVQTRLVIPEGWELRRIAPRIAEVTGAPADSVLAVLSDPATAEEYGVPGPTLEGYLYPATYQFPVGASLDRVVRRLVGRYQQAWTPERRARAEAMELSEREVVTLASIVEKEAKVWEERPTIARVYLNRLERGMRLQADPTVQYALGEHQSRLLFQHIDSVAGNPYNTYRNPGLPPGPIASPSAGAIEAVLSPAEHDYLFFVARPDGTHVFTRTFAEHRRAVAAARRAAREGR